MKSQKGNTLLITIIIASIAIGSIIYFALSNKMSEESKVSLIYSPTPKPSSTYLINQNSDEAKIFQSKNLKFMVNLPNNYQASEKSIRVTLRNSDAEVYVERNGTNFDNLEDYLRDLDSKNKVGISEEKQTIINNYETNIRTLKFTSGENQRVYTIYIDGWIYTIFTNSPTLYDDLDQIAQSFRYTP